MIVPDSSITLAFVLSNELSDAAARVFDDAATDGILVPQHWRLEIANALSLAIRRGRVTQEFRAQALADLALLRIETDAHTNAHIWSETLSFADRFRLTLYDAAYLELAYRRNLPLATLYDDLRTAAGQAGVKVLPE